MFHAIIWREKWARFHGEAPCRSGHLTVLQWIHGFVSCLFSYLKILLLDLTSSPPITFNLQTSMEQHPSHHRPACWVYLTLPSGLHPAQPLHIYPRSHTQSGQPYPQCPQLPSLDWDVHPTGHCFHLPPSHPCHIQFWGSAQPTHLVLFPSLLCSHQTRTNKSAMYRSHHRNAHSVKDQSTTQPPDPPVLEKCSPMTITWMNPRTQGLKEQL